jgi:MFS family permease
MLPMISDALALSDMQGAALTSSYSYLYALALVPVGMLADRAHRPLLLGVGITAWSALTLAGSHAHGFWELMATRVGVAAAHSTQNVICFSMVPDLFPANKATGVLRACIYLFMCEHACSGLLVRRE